MMRALHAWVLVCAAAGCATGAEYGVQVRIDPSVDRSQWATVELFVVDSCDQVTVGQPPPAGAVRQQQLLRPDLPSMPLGPVRPGSVGLYAIGRHQQCFVVASGCQNHTIAPDRGGMLQVTIFAQPLGVNCAQNELCLNGECLANQRCPDGQQVCFGQCVTLATHSGHCGACGRACAAGQACTAGQCR